ncbi:uncharacterized protein LODBEIA_P40800 [Lodderomyces beijingensis]|uniref:Serine/threonine-protein phosphatase n=1 Tax=Lodderomyces beijingensis TaxID=1775926 RepID=A0ABP0ZSD8_9ASCO
MGNSPSKNEPLPRSLNSNTTIRGGNGTGDSTASAVGGNSDLDPDDIALGSSISSNKLQIPPQNHANKPAVGAAAASAAAATATATTTGTVGGKSSQHATSAAIEIKGARPNSEADRALGLPPTSKKSQAARSINSVSGGNHVSTSKSRYSPVQDVTAELDAEIGTSMAKLLREQQDVSSSVDSSEGSVSSPVFTTIGSDLKDTDSLSSLNSSPGNFYANGNGKSLSSLDHQDAATGVVTRLDSIAENSPSFETVPQVKRLSKENLRILNTESVTNKSTASRLTRPPSSASASTSASSIPTNKKLEVDIDGIIQRLLATKKRSSSRRAKDRLDVDTNDIKYILGKSRQIFLDQPTLLRLSPPVKIVGDIHGQFHDLIRIFNCCGYPPHSNYLFLGDYVDRGEKSLETILLLLCYKIKYPENFFMLRGNHESANITKIYGFYDECKRRLKTPKLWKNFVDVFNSLPIAATINEKIFCVHGGLSPELESFKQIEDIKRPTDVPDRGLLADLLWSDPDASVKNFSLTNWPKNDRGVSYCFGKKHVDYFCSKFKLELVVRGHMVVEDGYEFFNKRKLVTVFSAPNYCGEFNNFGAIMSVDKSLFCSFELIKPT